MKGFYIAVIISSMIGSLGTTYLLHHLKAPEKEVIGPEINGYKVNACYQMKTDDPFDNEKLIIKIKDHKQHYIQYRFYHDTLFFFKYGNLQSDHDKWRCLFEEVPCPE